MFNSGKFFLFVFSFCLFTLATGNLYSKPWWAKPKTKAAKTYKKTQKKKYTYIRNHDLNHDGEVDNKDRLIWINKNKNDQTTVYVSKENEDIVEAMDADADGDVESWEMKAFYKTYDTNEDGVLDDEEIEEATE